MFAIIPLIPLVGFYMVAMIGMASAASLFRGRHDHDSLPFDFEDFIKVHRKVPLDQFLRELEEEEDASPALSDPAAAKPVVSAPATKRPDFRKGRRMLPILEEVRLQPILEEVTAATTLAATSPTTWVTVAPPPVGRWQPAAALEIVALALGLGLLVCLGLSVRQLVADKCRSGVVADGGESASANIAAAAAADPSPPPTESDSEQPQSHSRRGGCGTAVYYDCRLDDVHME